MKFCTKSILNSKNILNLILILLLIPVFSNAVIAQDLFGMLNVSPTSYVTKSKVTANGHLYITVWGSGAYRSTDKGESWHPINTGLTNVFLTDIEFISATEVMVSTMGGGIFKSNSINNINWVECNAGLTNKNVRSIKKYPNGMVLIGTYGSGIFKTTDKGANWIESSKGLLYKDVTTIEVADNGWIVAGTFGGGIYQSRDTAKTWTRQSSGLRNQYIHDIKRSPFDYLYAASNGRGIYLSPNDGITWAELDTFMTLPDFVDPVPLPDLNVTSITFNRNLNPVFGTRYGGVFAEDREVDYSWIPTNVRGIGVTTMCQNADSMYCFSPNFTPHSTNKVGEFWSPLYNYPMALFAKSYGLFTVNEREIVKFSTVDVGANIEKSTDDGITWSQPINFSRTINQITVDSSGNYYLATRIGLYKTTLDFSSFNIMEFADKRVYDFKVAPNGYFYVIVDGDSNRRVLYSTNKGANWQVANITFDLNFPHEVLGINRNGHIYATMGDKVFVSIDNGAKWTPSLPFPSRVNCIAFLSDNTVLVGTRENGMYKSSSPFQFQKNDKYPQKTIQLLHVDKNDNIYATGRNDFMYILMGDSKWEATYKSTNKGASFFNINKDFHGDQIINFASNKFGDLYMTTTSGMIYRAIDRKNLSVPQLYALPDKSNDIDVDSVFSWSTARRAELYQIQISYDEDFSYIWEEATQLDTVHRIVGLLYPNHEYFWRVRAKNHDAVSDWSEVRTFYSKLKTPGLISPEDKSKNIPVYANLTWDEVEGATSYIIQLSKKANFADTAFSLSSNSPMSVSPLLEGRSKYYWRVMAKNEVSTSNWSVVWSFETVFGPPTLLSPSDKSFGHDIALLMVWNKATEVSEYDIQISKDLDFTEIIMDSEKISTTSINSQSLEYDKTYYWRVRSRKAEVISEWSLIWSFRTGYSPVVLITPANEAVNVVIKTELTWEQHPTQSKYELEVAKSQDFTNNVVFETLDNQTNFVTSNLESYQDYFWRSRVISEENLGIWSNTNKFKTKVNVINLRVPGDNTANHPLSIGFMWFNTKGAKTYHLQIATDATFNDLIFSQDTITNITHTFSQLNPGLTYFWRARAVTPEGVGDWSDVWQFTTGSNIPILTLPDNGNDKVVNPIKFQWVPVTGAIKYELNVSENTDFAQTAINENDIVDNFYITSELGYPKTFYWRIRAILSDGPSNWSQVWSFSTKDPSNVKDIVTLSETEIYPNPASHSIKIRLSGNTNPQVNLKILDMTGSTIFDGKVEVSTNDMINWDCSGYPSGVYFLMINTTDKLFKGEIIINR